MYSHAIILAVLSAGALADNTASIFLTAFDPTDTACTGTAAGNNVTVTAEAPTQPKTFYASDCIPYAPDHGQNIHFDFYAPNISYSMEFFSESNCKNESGSVSGWWQADNCYSMNDASYGDEWASHFNVDGADWKSVRMQLGYGR